MVTAQLFGPSSSVTVTVSVFSDNHQAGDIRLTVVQTDRTNSDAGRLF
jgi:hypothetical protein